MRDEPSALALEYSARIVAHEKRIDVPVSDMEELTRWESHVLTKTARKNGYTFHVFEPEAKYWLTRESIKERNEDE